MNSIARVRVVCCRHEAIEADLLALFPVRPAHTISRVERRECEACALALLRGKILAGGQVERSAEDGKRAAIFAFEFLEQVEPVRQKIGHQRRTAMAARIRRLQAAAHIEARKWVGASFRGGRAQIAARKTVAVKRLHGELIDIQAPAEERCHQGENHGATHERKSPGKRPIQAI